MSEQGGKIKGLAWLGVGFGLAACFALGLQWMARQVPWWLEKRIGAALGTPPGLEACDPARHPASQAAFRKLVARIFPLESPGSKDADLPIHVEAVTGSGVNAFALPGGRIYVFRGLIRQAMSPEELAGVLAHEIEHVKRRHVMQGVIGRLLTGEALRLVFGGSAPMDAETAHLLLNMKFGREQEHEADVGGLERLKAAQVSAAGFEAFFSRAPEGGALPALLSDHPASADRAELAHGYGGYPTRPVLDAKEWAALKRICE